MGREMAGGFSFENFLKSVTEDAENNPVENNAGCHPPVLDSYIISPTDETLALHNQVWLYFSVTQLA